LNCAPSHASNRVNPARVAGSLPTQESIVNLPAVPGRWALASTVLCLSASFACAQSATPAQDSIQGSEAAAPLQLEMPAQPVTATLPEETSDNAVVDAQDSAASERKRGPEVHGSVTAGIGYSSGYGTTTFEAADFDISGQSDSGRDVGVRIHVEQSKGLGYGPYGGYYPVR
jgi:hypothetical protein